MQTLYNPWRYRVAVLVLIFLVVCSARFLQAQQETPPVNDPVYRVKSVKSKMRLIERFAKIVELGKYIDTVYGFDREIITVTPVKNTPNQIRIHAVAAGVTSLVLLDEEKRIYTVEVLVEGDVRHLQAQLDRLFPDASVEAVAVSDESVVLRGWVVQPENITQMMDVAERHYGEVLNQMKVGGAQQVQLNVRIMEVQRGKIRELGLNFMALHQDGFLASTPGQIAPLIDISVPFGGPPSLESSPASLAANTLVGAVTTNNTIFLGFLNALKRESLLKILAEPTLMTTNGRTAQLLAGGEFPVLVPQSLGTATITWKKFGVSLEAVPILLGNGRVRLELQPEVSERDFSVSVTTAGFTVPGLKTRRVNTQVEMRFGETFMLAGLLSMRRTAESDKIPFLGELPWIGTAFRKIKYDETETELVIMVTPYLVGAMKPGQVPEGGPGLFTDVPTDRELFFDGFLEVPKYGDECASCTTLFPLNAVTTTTYTRPYSGTTGSGLGLEKTRQPSSSASDDDLLFELPPPAPQQKRSEPTSKSAPLGKRLFKWSTALNPFSSSRKAPSRRTRQSNYRMRQSQSRKQTPAQRENTNPQPVISQSVNRTDRKSSSNFSSLSSPRFELIEPKPGLIQP